jgi:hypothetical protein
MAEMNPCERTLRLAAILAFGALVAIPVLGAVRSQSDGDWKLFSPDDEEFSVAVPAAPTVFIREKDYYPVYGGAWVVKRVSYSGYASGFVFVIDSYKSNTPKSLLENVERGFRDLGGVRFQRFQQTSLGGLPARKYLDNRSAFISHVFTVVTKKHVYTIMAAAKEPTNLNVDKFLSSFQFGDSGKVGTIEALPEDSNLTTGSFSEPIIAPRSADVKPIVVWKPVPLKANVDQPGGGIVIVVLRGAMTASGEVLILEIVKRQRDGLTEKAIEAAKNIKFFPAKKDGKPVSVRMQFEYGFKIQ